MARFILIWLLMTLVVGGIGPVVVLGVHELAERVRTRRFERRIGWREDN